MSLKRIVLLDGTPAGQENLVPLHALLREMLAEIGAAVSTFTLREIGMAHCIGCFGCWIETPGVCIEADAGRELTGAIIQSDMVVLFTPVSFGGYSAALKKLVDRWLPLIMPYFYKEHGEIHHTPRYAQYPRLVGIGVQHHPDPVEAEIFKLVVGRNAINFHAPSFAADVFVGADASEMLRERMRSLLTRQDALPFGEAVTSMMPRPVAFEEGKVRGRAQRALLIIGSPKIKSPSTSGVLGGYLLERMKEQGWQTESLTLNAALLQEKGEAEFLAAVERADLLILAFPLYIDALPFLVTRALETIAVHRCGHPDAPEQMLVSICNNGFPEAHQNGPALAICREFALQCNITWAGCLALGAGEALSSGDPLSARGGNGHPPAKHVMQALDLAAKALAERQPVPGGAQKLLEKCPIPFIPSSLWIWLFPKVGQHYWKQRAALHGVLKRDLSARFYEG